MEDEKNIKRKMRERNRKQKQKEMLESKFKGSVYDTNVKVD